MIESFLIGGHSLRSPGIKVGKRAIAESGWIWQDVPVRSGGLKAAVLP